MMATARPNLITARVEGGEVIISGDGVELVRMRVRRAIWLIARMAEEIALSRA